MKYIDVKKIVCVCLYFFLMYGLFEILAMINDGKILYSIASLFSNGESFNIAMNYFIFITLLVVCVIFERKEMKEEFLEFRKTTFINNVGKVFYFYIISLLLTAVGNVIVQLLGGGATSDNQGAVDSMLKGKYFILSCIVVAIIGPIVEELIFRKCLIGALQKLKLKNVFCIIISSIMFGLIHVLSYGDFVQCFPYIFMGAVFAIAYIDSKNIYIPIFVHILNNAIAVLLIVVGG